MVVSQARSKRKSTGGKYISAGKKRKYEIGRSPTHTKVGEKHLKKIRTRGGNSKTKSLWLGEANILDPESKKYSKVKISSVVENTANRHYVRRNIITKGAVIETEKGKAKVTSRPGQEGTVNAVLVTE